MRSYTLIKFRNFLKCKFYDNTFVKMSTYCKFLYKFRYLFKASYTLKVNS